VFSVTILVQRSTLHTQSGAFQLRQNGTVRLSLFADTHQTDLDTAVVSGSAVLYLNIGDEVDVIGIDANLYIGGSQFKYSFFSGFLIG